MTTIKTKEKNFVADFSRIVDLLSSNVVCHMRI